MTILTKDESRPLLAALFQQFGYDESEAMKYLNKKLLWFGILSGPPLLWYPQNDTRKYVRQVYEDVIQLKSWTLEDETTFPQVLSFFNQENVDSIYGLAPNSPETAYRLISFSSDELPDIRQKVYSDGYFFPADLSWMYVMTHEHFSFLAGSKSFINKFKRSFPDYKNYLFPYDMLGQPSSGS